MRADRAALPGLRLGDLEVAAGFPIGSTLEADPKRFDPPAPRAALEAAVIAALQRPPCVVSFSGGRDSSAILAIATSVARREGLAAPIPISLRFPTAATSVEDSWQELVVGHLGLDGWERVSLTNELDLVGPVATRALRRHGLLWPPNTHVHEPILERARGGSVLTGIDGDGLLASWRHQRIGSLLARRRRPRPGDVFRLVDAAAPRALRRWLARRRPTPSLRWLRTAAAADLHDELAREAASEPSRWDRWVRWYARQRSLRFALESFDCLARDHDVAAVHPLADAAFIESLGRLGGRTGIGGRTAAMYLLAGDLLPDELLERRSKAALDGALWCRYSREFTSGWDGAGVNAELVDPVGLQLEWEQATPHAGSSTLLQAAWIASATPDDDQ